MRTIDGFILVMIIAVVFMVGIIIGDLKARPKGVLDVMKNKDIAIEVLNMDISPQARAAQFEYLCGRTIRGN